MYIHFLVRCHYCAGVSLQQQFSSFSFTLLCNVNVKGMCRTTGRTCAVLSCCKLQLWKQVECEKHKPLLQRLFTLDDFGWFTECVEDQDVHQKLIKNIKLINSILIIIVVSVIVIIIIL